MDIELIRRVLRALGRDSTNSRSAPRELLCGARSTVAGVAGLLSDAHGDADATVEIHYQINVNRTYSHASTASTSVVKSMPVYSSCVIVCSQVILNVHCVSWVHGDVGLGKVNISGHTFIIIFGPFLGQEITH